MKRRLLSAVLALAMLLLCGCAAGPDPAASTADFGTGTEPFSDYRQKVMDLAALRTFEYDGSTWIARDPDRQIYIFTPKYDKDLFPGSGYGPSIFVFSRTPLDPQDISLRLPCQTGYTLQFWADHSENCRIKITDSKQRPQTSLHEYQYYAMQGIDWKELGQVKALADAANALALEHGSDQEAYQAYQKLSREYQADYEAYTAEYHAQYVALKTEEIPRFYLYQFLISFPEVGMYEETVEGAELTVNGEKYPLEIGQIRIHKTTPQIILDNNPPVGIVNYRVTVSGIGSSPFSGGYEKKTGVFDFVADQDMTLTGVREVTCGTELGLLGARVRIDGMPDHFWDMQMPLDIAAGSKVEIDLYFKDPRIEEYTYGTTACLLLEYEIRGNAYAYQIEGNFERHHFMWDIYLMAFEGCGIEEYYAYILAPYENDWLSELPEAFRN